jgi:phosphoglycerate kinase
MELSLPKFAEMQSEADGDSLRSQKKINLNIKMKTINDFNFKDKKALVRVDFNVPQDDQLNVTDNTRIVAVKPTVEKILKDGGSVILMTHLGRPKGEVKDEFSLKHIIGEVSSVLGQEVNLLMNVLEKS